MRPIFSVAIGKFPFGPPRATWLVVIGALCLVGSAKSQVLNAPNGQQVRATTDRSRKENPETEKFARLHNALRKRPESTAIFERLVAEWTTYASLAELQTWLAKISERGDGNDALILAFFSERWGGQTAIADAANAFQLAWERDAIAAKAGDDAKSVPGFPGRAGTGLARMQAKQGEFESALKTIDQATERGLSAAHLAEILQLQARWLRQLGRNDEAIKMWQNALTASPDDIDLWEEAIDEFWNHDNANEAISTLRRLIAAHAASEAYDTARRRLWLTEMLNHEGDDASADEQYQTLLKDAGNGSWLERAVIASIEQRYRARDDIRGLTEHLQEFVNQHTARLALHFRLGEVLIESGQGDDGFAQIATVLKRSPGELIFRERFARLLEKSNRPAEAVEQWQHLVSHHPGNTGLLLDLARAGHQNGQDEAARQSIRTWVEKQTNPTQLQLTNAADLMAAYGDLDAAEHYLRQSVEKFPAKTRLQTCSSQPSSIRGPVEKMKPSKSGRR